MLAIEIDGETHNYKIWRDRERQKRLEGSGVRFLRFTDEDVKQNIEGVVGVIERWVRENQANMETMKPTPAPLPRGDLRKAAPLPRGDLRKAAPLPRGDSWRTK